MSRRPPPGLGAALAPPALALLALAPLAPAQASPLFELWGAQGEGGLSARVVPAGAASAYFNPALLPEASADFDLGVVVLRDEIGVTLRGRPNAASDVSVASVEAERPGGGRLDRYGVPTEWLERGKAAEPPDQPLAARPRQAAGSAHQVRSYQVVGLVKKLLQQRHPDRLAVGLYAMIPYRRFTGAAAFYSDEREQYFSNSLHPELYADRLSATSLAFGAGARPLPRLSLGASFTLALRTQAGTPTFLADVGRFQDILVDSEVGVKAAVAPHFGAAYRLGPDTRLAATIHSPQKMEIGTDFSFFVSNGIEQRARVRFTHAYLPWTFAVGGSHRLAAGDGAALSLAGTLIHARWSSYRDRHDERPAAAYGWYDTLAGVLGLRYRGGPAGLGLDLGYQPSPVPDQSGRTNYVDNDRASAAGSASWRWAPGGVGVELGLSAQVHRLLPRSVSKLAPGAPDAARVLDEVPDDVVRAGEPLPGREGLQTNNPGWPGFASEGWIVGGGFSLSLAL